jgi:hypothetical protein
MQNFAFTFLAIGVSLEALQMLSATRGHYGGMRKKENDKSQKHTLTKINVVPLLLIRSFSSRNEILCSCPVLISACFASLLQS